MDLLHILRLQSLARSHRGGAHEISPVGGGLIKSGEIIMMACQNK
jgi:hypothetical protein